MGNQLRQDPLIKFMQSLRVTNLTWPPSWKTKWNWRQNFSVEICAVYGPRGQNLTQWTPRCGKKRILKTWKCLIPLGFPTSQSWGKPMMGAYVWPQLVPLKFKVLFSNLANTPIASTQYAMLWVCSDNWKHRGTIDSGRLSQILRHPKELHSLTFLWISEVLHRSKYSET